MLTDRVIYFAPMPSLDALATLALASLFRALRECALCKRIATRRSAKTYRQGGFQFRCDTHSEPGENWIDLPHASILRRYDV